MKNISVNFETSIPEGVGDAEVLEWLMFRLGGGGCSINNPLIDIEIEANWSSIDFKDVPTQFSVEAADGQ